MKEPKVKISKEDRARLGRLMKSKNFDFEKVYMYTKYADDLAAAFKGKVSELEFLRKGFSILLRKGLLPIEIDMLRSDMTYKEYCDVMNTLIEDSYVGNFYLHGKKNFHDFAALKEFFRRFDKIMSEWKREENEGVELEKYEKVFKVLH